MNKTIYEVTGYHRVIGENQWHYSMTLCAFKNKEKALRFCAKKNENSQGIFLEFKYEVHAVEFYD